MSDEAEVVGFDQETGEPIIDPDLVTNYFNSNQLDEVHDLLLEPFDSSQERVRQGRGGFEFTYVDAKTVMDRLDEVVGPDNWSSENKFVYAGEPTTVELNGRQIPAQKVVMQCDLVVFGTSHSGVGEAFTEDEPFKSAESDAFKRAAVAFGVGRYLYSKERSQSGNGYSQTSAPKQSHLADQAQKEGLQRVDYSDRKPQSVKDGAPPISTAQMGLIEKLIAQSGTDYITLDEWTREHFGTSSEGLSKYEAMKTIDYLKNLPKMQ